MPHFLAELLGALPFVLFGDGVAVNMLHNKSKAQNSRWSLGAESCDSGFAISVDAVNSISDTLAYKNLGRAISA